MSTSAPCHQESDHDSVRPKPKADCVCETNVGPPSILLAHDSRRSTCASTIARPGTSLNPKPVPYMYLVSVSRVRLTAMSAVLMLQAPPPTHVPIRLSFPRTNEAPQTEGLQNLRRISFPSLSYLTNTQVSGSPGAWGCLSAGARVLPVAVEAYYIHTLTEPSIGRSEVVTLQPDKVYRRTLDGPTRVVSGR